MSSRCGPQSSAASASFAAGLHFIASKQAKKERARQSSSWVQDYPRKVKETTVGSTDEKSGPTRTDLQLVGTGLHDASRLGGHRATEYDLLDEVSSKEDGSKDCIGLHSRDDIPSDKEHGEKDRRNQGQSAIDKGSSEDDDRFLPQSRDLVDGNKLKQACSAFNTSPDVDGSSAIPRESLRKYLESASAFTQMVNGVVKRILRRIRSRTATSRIVAKAVATISNFTNGSTYATKCKQVLADIGIVNLYAMSTCTLIVILLMMCNYVSQLKTRNAQLETGIVSLKAALHNQPAAPKQHSDIDVGVPPALFREQKIINVHFHGFSTFDSTKAQAMRSRPFSCFNHKWQVELYPGGHSEALDGMTSIYLRQLSKGPIAVDFGFALNKSFLRDGSTSDNGPQVASYSSVKDVPRCQNTGTECSSADLLVGRGRGSESRENTLDSCADGNAGSYLRDESVEQITVKSNTGSHIREGDTITIEADIFCHSKRSFADIYHARNPSNPVWDYIDTYRCTTDGHTKVMAQHKLTGSEHEQAVRVVIRNSGSRKPCSGGKYDDVDDLVFQVKQRDVSHKFESNTSSLAGYQNFLERSFLSNPRNLSHGTLSVELRMKLVENKSLANLFPDNHFSRHMLELFLDEQSADVLFELSSGDNSFKIQYHAHCLVLKACAPALARLCEGSDKMTPIAIPDIEPRVFLQILQFIYGGDISPDWDSDAKKFIDAADKYDLMNLKVTAEAWHVVHFRFTADNVVEELLYADARNCPLLREAAIRFISTNAKEVMKSQSFENVLMAKTATKEIMLAMASPEQGSDSGDYKDDSEMSINYLRTALYERGLELYGSRELLVSRLRNNSEVL